MITEYTITCGQALSPDDASSGVFPPDATVVYVDREDWGSCVTYRYLVEHEPFAA